MNKFSTSFLLAGLVLPLACNKVDDNAAVMQQDVKLTPIITRALSLNFRENDKIGVNIKLTEDGSLYAENAMMTYDGTCFSGDVKWYKDGSATSTVTAWYPYSESGFPSTFTVESDQSTGSEASDFMLAVEKDVYPSSNAVLAKFHHQFSQINVVIKADFDVLVDEVVIKNVIPTALLSFGEDGTLAVTPDANASVSDIKAEEINAGKLYSAVLVPQDLSSFGLSVKIKNGNTILSGIKDASLKPGYAYTITALVSADQVKTSISGDIVAWEDGGLLNADDYEVPFEEHDDYFLYDGVRYNTVTIYGCRWMASSLAYIPVGMTASADPNSGNIFYPYTTDGTTAEALTDNASAKAKGYLYTVETALGGVKLDDSNYSSFEGVQGICPKGWHVPTRAEYFSLCGQSIRSAVLGETAQQTDENAFCWDKTAGYAHIGKFNEAGFNWSFSGMLYNSKYNVLNLSDKNCNVAEYYGEPAVTYLLTSSALSVSTNAGGTKYNYGVLMTTFNNTYPLGRLSISQLAHNSGAAALRCVKDAE